jgi:hypothetical protein
MTDESNPIDLLVLAMRACEPQALALLDHRQPIPHDVADRIRGATQTLAELVSLLDRTNLEMRRRKYQPTSLHELMHRHESTEGETA